MKKSISLVLAAAVALTVSIPQAAEVVPVHGKASLAASHQVLTVSNIDHEKRRVTLMNSEGEEHTFVAGPQVRNLAQIQEGDKVSILHAEAVAVAVYPVAAAGKGRVVHTEVSRAPLGAKPYGTITRRVEITGRLAALKPKTREVTIEGKYGDLNLIAADDVDLSRVKVGDKVRLVYVERLSISVEAPE